TGFIAASGVARAASAWIHWALPISAGPISAGPISAPSPQTIELLDMFWLLNGATLRPRRANARQSPVVTMLFPASEVVPATRRAPRVMAAAYRRPDLGPSTRPDPRRPPPVRAHQVGVDDPDRLHQRIHRGRPDV